MISVLIEYPLCPWDISILPPPLEVFHIYEQTLDFWVLFFNIVIQVFDYIKNRPNNLFVTIRTNIQMYVRLFRIFKSLL